MLHLILGEAGTGKTTLVLERIAKTVRAGKRAILLVPEQASFESEKALYRALGPKDVLGVEVLSFTRLCNHVFREFGDMAGIHMEDTAKLLMMSIALEQMQAAGELRIYHKNAGTAPFVSAMCDVIHELKSAGVTPEKLREAGEVASGQQSIDKFFDLSIIYDAYQALVDQGYDDTDDHLMRAAGLLEHQGYFAEREVFVDGFVAFMGAERRLLRQMLTDGCELTVALCCKELYGSRTEDVFAAAASTAMRLIQDAGVCGAKVSPPVKLCKVFRFTEQGLSGLAAAFPSLRPEPLQNTDGLSLMTCDNFYDELETVAARIAALVREGYRYREIAVIARSLDRYQAALETVFFRYEIPYFMDRRTDVEVYPLIRGILCALEAVQSGFDTEPLLTLARSGLTGLDAARVGELENYCYIWGINKKSWREPFQDHPDGMKGEMTETKARRLERINETRAELMDGLLSLEEALKDCDGLGFARGIYGYLTQIDGAKNLHQAASEMESMDEKRFLEEGAQIWDALMSVLDIFGGALGEVHFPLKRFLELLKLSVTTMDVGMLPQTLDQVLVGTADRIRPNRPRAVFVIGLNEGEFPQRSQSSGILSNAEREGLRQEGIDLLRTQGQQALLESFYVYFALTQASERLFLSYPAQDTAGRGLAPSSAVLQVLRVCGKQLVRYSNTLNLLDRVSTEKTAFDLMARGWRTNSPEQAALRTWFYEAHPAKMAELEALSDMRPFSLERPEGKALFAGDLRLSPSRLERFFSCPFSFFCDSGLKLASRRRVEFNPLISGSVIHLVLQEMVQSHMAGRALSSVPDALLRSESAAIIQRELQEKIRNPEEMPARFRYLFERQVETLTRVLHHLGQEFDQMAFQPVKTELRIREGSAVAPMKLWASDGSRVIVEGVVDRLDAMVYRDNRYLRVVDYKTGLKKFDLADVCGGLNMQMLIYLFALCDSYETSSGLLNQPAGVLYMPARNDVVNAERAVEAGRLEKLRGEQLKMNGLLLDDQVSLSGMEPGLSGIYIPIKTNKDGIDRKRSALVTPPQMKAVRAGVEERLKGMADSLKRGRIEALPVGTAEETGDRMVCQNCEFASICRHEEDDPFRTMAKLDKAEALAELGYEPPAEKAEEEAETPEAATAQLELQPGRTGANPGKGEV